MKKAIYLLLVTFIFLYVTNCSCNGTSGRNIDNNPSLSAPEVVSKPVLNVFLENSGSMDGYVNGNNAEFASTIYRYLSLIDNSGSIKDSIDLNYINSEVIPLGNDITKFSSKELTPSSFRNMGGKRVSTDISKLLETVLGKTNNDTISMLISDLIFSPGSGVDASKYLVDQETEIMGLITRKFNNSNLAIVIHQLNSNFNGTYFNKVDSRSNINNSRPYFICFFGEEQYLEQIPFDVLLDDDFISTHFENKYIVSKEQSVKYAVQVGSGNFKLDRRNTQKSIIKARIDNRTNNLSCVVNVNFDILLLDDSYLTNKSNYIIDENFQLEEIKPTVIEGFTHSIKWSTTIPQSTTLSIGLSNSIPDWVYQTSDSSGEDLIKDDAIDKTYGLKYLIEGIHEPYSKASDYYTEIKININQ